MTDLQPQPETLQSQPKNGTIAPDKDCLSNPILTDNAVIVLRNRYLKKDDKGEICEDTKDLFIRNAECVAAVEKPELQEHWFNEFYEVMSLGYFLPNSPCLMNAGRPLGMLSACFVLGIDDDLHSILDTQKDLAIVQRAGGGTGFNFSNLRPRGSIVRSSGGETSGPIAFIKAYSSTTDAIQQGAFRRGANMGILRVDHPDIIEFIRVKEDLTKLQNYNLSVAIPEEFMHKLSDTPLAHHKVCHYKWGEGHLWVHRETKKVKAFRRLEPPFRKEYDPWSYSDTWELICKRAWETGEPGLFFIDEANENSPIPNVGRITATNPCGEQPLHEWDSCNLGSLDLSKYIDKSTGKIDLDWDLLDKHITIATRFLDNMIDANNYPLEKIKEMAHQTRRIGLGVMGFADILYAMAIPYNSIEARNLATQIQLFISEKAKLTSVSLGVEKGNFGAWTQSVYGPKAVDEDFFDYTGYMTPPTTDGTPMRNSYRTTVAPTGTISIIADCSGGIEPLFALTFTRQVMPNGDGIFTKMTEHNKWFTDFLDTSNLSEQICFDLLQWAEDHGSIQEFCANDISSEETEIIEEAKRIFVVASDINMEDHIVMQAAWQQGVDSAISKTINLSANATIDDVKEAYKLAHSLLLKGVTVYRDGCRDGVAGMKQPMSVNKKEPLNMGPHDADCEPRSMKALAVEYDKIADLDIAPPKSPFIIFMPALKTSLRTQWGHLHVTIVEDDKGKPTEFFAQLGKAGDMIAADLEAICRLGSLALRSDIAIEDVIKQLTGIGSVAVAPSEHGKITSLPDALSKVLSKYCDYKVHQMNLQVDHPISTSEDIKWETPSKISNEFVVSDSKPELYAQKCPTCGGSLAFQEGCLSCRCGFSQC